MCLVRTYGKTAINANIADTVKRVREMKNNYKGMNFRDWCALDVEDDRKINYTLYGVWDNAEHEEFFTSEDLVEPIMLFRLQTSIIEQVELSNNEWYVTLIY